MKGPVALLILALFQHASAVRISSCSEEINHAPDLNGQGCFSSKIATGEDYYLRAAVPDNDLEKAKFECSKLKFGAVNNGKRIIKTAVLHEGFKLSIIKELTKVEKAKVIGKGQYQGKMIKSVTTSLGKITDAYYPYEKEMRHPGISYYSSFFLDDTLWGFWECDRHAEPDNASLDYRFFFSKGATANFNENHAKFVEFKGSDGADENNFEGELKLLPADKVQKCASLTFDDNIA